MPSLPIQKWIYVQKNMLITFTDKYKTKHTQHLYTPKCHWQPSWHLSTSVQVASCQCSNCLSSSCDNFLVVTFKKAHFGNLPHDKWLGFLAILMGTNWSEQPRSSWLEVSDADWPLDVWESLRKGKMLWTSSED